MRIIQKKKEEHRTHNRADSDRIWTETETIQWLLAHKSLTVRR
jgi:hypothetical protein